MRIDILTLFPGMFAPLQESILKRAQQAEAMQIVLHDLREHGVGNYRQVDDNPYGGGGGMLLRVDVLVPALESIISNATTNNATDSSLLSARDDKPYSIYLSPRGDRLQQPMVEQFAEKNEWLLLVCGHYEGVDQRFIDGWIDQELSIGDYVLTGGELPAMVLVDAVARQLPGVLGGENSAHEESFSVALQRKKEYPHYTRPEEFRGLKVPDILLSGHHANIQQWRTDNLQ